MIVTRAEAHDILTDLQRNRPRLAPGTLRLLRQLEDAYAYMDTYALATILVQVKRQHQKEGAS